MRCSNDGTNIDGTSSPRPSSELPNDATYSTPCGGEETTRRTLLPLLVVLAALAVVWGLIFLVLPPADQNFPLNDDWAYAKGLFALARGDGINYYGQPSMPMLGQWLWALPFVWVLGESHVALRLSTITLSCLGAVAFYDLARHEGELAPRQAAFAVASFVLNPLVFVLSGTYMTDVPALSFGLIALALYALSLRTGRQSIMAAATAVAVLAVITRQTMLAIPIAAATTLFATRPPAWHRLAAWLFLPVLAGLGVHIWLNARPDTVPQAPICPTPVEVAFFTFVAIHTLGIALLPVFALWPPKGSIEWKVFIAAFLILLNGAALLLACAKQLPYGGLFPYVMGSITPWGDASGPHDFMIVGYRAVLMGREIRMLLTALGCLGGAALLARIVTSVRAGRRLGALAFFTMFQFVILLFLPNIFDRYFLAMLPGLICLAASPGSQSPKWDRGLVALAVIAIFSAGLTHDWLAWNSARWKVGRRALDRGIAASEIEGGSEWDGWYSNWPAASIKGSVPPPQGLMLPFNRLRFPRLTGRFALAFTQPPGTVQVDSEPYFLWLPQRQQEFLLVEQDPRADR